MLRIFIISVVLIFNLNASSQVTVTMRITSLPAYHPSGSDVFIAGSFNGWNPQDNNFKFTRSEKGEYFLKLSLAAGKYEYKITRGGWDKTECKTGGTGMDNRKLDVNEDSYLDIAIEEWTDRFPSQPVVSTAGKNVHIIDTAFYLPELKRTRRIWIYLPKDYDRDQQKHYPVLYMHDGQNLFDNATSFSGEWGVDEFLDSTELQSCIVVGIDHGGNKRLNEYNPYDNEKFGKGEGKKYLKFIVRTLKPYVDGTYRTLRDKENTFIAGSSMGGLISMYALLEYPKVFGVAGVFSPAFWISGEKIFDDIRKKSKNLNSKIYMYGGKLEGETMVPDMVRAVELLNKHSKANVVSVIREEGRHSETRWRKEFPGFYAWLLQR